MMGLLAKKSLPLAQFGFDLLLQEPRLDFAMLELPLLISCWAEAGMSAIQQQTALVVSVESWLAFYQTKNREDWHLESSPLHRLWQVVSQRSGLVSACLESILMGGMQDKDVDVRRDAVKAVGDLGAQASEALKAGLLRLMQDENDGVRGAAVQAVVDLGAHANELLKAGLLGLMQDKEWWVRLTAVSSLAKTPDGLKLLCTATFPNQPLAIPASQSIVIPDAGAFVDASAKDTQKVVDLYEKHRVPGYEVRSVRIVYNPNFNRNFQGKLHNLQQRQGSKAFAPSWQNENEPQWREQTHQQLVRWAAP